MSMSPNAFRGENCVKMRCSVQNCTNDTRRTTKSHGITFHMFPKEQSLRTAWVEALGISQWEPKDRSTVCSEHFRNNDFYLTKNGLRKIKNGAVPVVVHDSAEDLDAPAALRVCRVCLAMDTKMYHINEHKLNAVYEQIIGVPLADDDKLPQKVCWECAHRMITASGFRARALRTQAMLHELTDSDRYITIRDIKSINRTHNRLKSTLVFKHFETDDYDDYIHDTRPPVKEESGGEREDEEGAVEDVDDREDVAEDRSVRTVKEEVLPDEDAIKDETSNEIFFEEYVDNFDDSDDMALSEVYADVAKTKVTKKKKKLKTGKKVKEKRAAKKRDADESPTSTMDKYKTSDVKRRRTADNIDTTLFTVTQLTYEEQVQEVQRRKQLASYTGAPYRCHACYRGFLRKDRFDAHNVRHSEQSGAYECFICRTRLKTARALRKHLTAQHTLKYSCKGCAFVTRNKGVAREHEKWHAGAKYQCPHCPSEFDKLTTYLGHVRIKHVSDCVCELCGFTFVSKKGIDVHKKKKHRVVDKPVMEGPYCEICDVRFISEEAHERHLKLSSKHSSDDDPNRIRNDSQNVGCESNGRVMRKIERRPVIHPRVPGETRVCPGEPVTCEQCGVQLRDLRLYAQHFRRAHPDKNRTKYPAMKTPCMCEQCGRIFQSMALLKDHMWVHTGEKRFKCERCDKSFTQKTNLVFHMRVHSATRPTYECPLCGKHFAFFNNRRRHMFIHTGLKPYKCDTCGKSFTTAGEQRAHVEHVHMKKPWPKRARAQRSADWGKCGERED